LGDVDKQARRMQNTAFWGAVAAGLLTIFAVVALFFSVIRHFKQWPDVLAQHFAAVVGLPVAVTVAFVIVSFLRQTDGPIEFEGLGFKFKGAAGQVVMWALCFMSMAAAIHWCW
jgi:hypothetical protein